MLKFFRTVFVFYLLSCVVIAHAAGVRAGSFIDNIANATFVDAGGIPSTIASNTVRATVQVAEAFTMTTSQSAYQQSSGGIGFPHHIVNTGNARVDIRLNYSNTAGDDFDMTSLRLILDINGNGTVDSGESVFPNGAVISLDIGASVDLIVDGYIPANIANGKSAKVTLLATSVGQAVVVSNTDTAVVSSSVAIDLAQSANITASGPGGIINYTLRIANLSLNRSAVGVPVSIDGVSSIKIIARNIIPANTTFYGAGAVNTSQILYHKAGDALNTYTAAPPSNGAAIDAVAFTFNSLPPGKYFANDFMVKANANASSSIINIAQAIFLNGISTVAVVQDSTQSVVSIALVPPKLELFTDETYSSIIQVATAGQKFYIKADAARCNISSQVAETKVVILSSALTADVESFVLTETGPNTGVFVIAGGVPTSGITGVSGDAILNVKNGDVVTATMNGCGSVQSRAAFFIDPYGVVFNSHTNAPVPGVTVRLIDMSGNGNGGNPGGPALVKGADGKTSFSANVTTDATGTFVFPLVAPSTYRLSITAPAGFTAPSTVSPGSLPAERRINVTGSYGKNFDVNFATGPVQIDVPLDTAQTIGLLVEKTASRKTVEIGDVLDYTVRVKNRSGTGITNIGLSDRLPSGFIYQAGTARLSSDISGARGLPVIDHTVGGGPSLRFELGSIDNESMLTLSYRVRVGINAQLGSAINQVQASSLSGVAISSNLATASVQVTAGVFSDRGYIFGSVYADCNKNQQRDSGEPGIPGVRLFMEDGTSVTTDASGKYSLYDISPRTHIVKVDVTTLPTQSRLKILTNRNSGDAGSVFVDMKNGQLRVADFAVDACSTELTEEVKRRATLVQVRETEQALTAPFNSNGKRLDIGDVRALPASGVLNASLSASPETAPMLPFLKEKPKLSDSVDVSALIDKTGSAAEIVYPISGQVLTHAQTNVVVKGAEGARFELTVNGETISDKKIGKRSVIESKQAQVFEYYGIDLAPGKNTIVFQQYDSIGTLRSTEQVTVIAPGKFAKVVLTQKNKTLTADGTSIVSVMISVEDDNGVPVRARIPVTIDANRQVIWKTVDLAALESGLQVMTEDGRAEISLVSPYEAGDLVLSATSGDVKATTTLSFLPNLRPLIAAGIVEGKLNLRNLNPKALIPARSADGFDAELQHFSRSFADGKMDAASRAALFLKGKVKGDYLLTLAYDSEKDKNQTLFRDIQPDQFYPVYGDSSTKNYDAQSTGKLYVRVDHGKSYAFYGDFSTQTADIDDPKKLGLYSRNLTGARTHYEEENVRTNAFASRDSLKQVIEEIPGRGISGPYFVRQQALENSEKVEILVRDKNQPGVILSTKLQARFTDYTVELLSGQIVFRAPIPTLDADFNPVSVRVTYEVDQGGPQFWVAGADAQIQVTKNISVGGSAVQDSNPQDPNRLLSANVVIKLAEKTSLTGEVAQTSRDSIGLGNAERIEFKHDGKSLQATAFAGKTSATFDNPASIISKGRSEAGAKATVKIDDENILKTDLIRSGNVVTGETRTGMLVGVEHTFSSTVRGEIGVRKVAEKLPTSVAPVDPQAPPVIPIDGTSVRARVTTQVPGVKQATVFGEYEQDIADSSKKMAAIGGEYRLDNGGRVYMRHEFTSTLGDRSILTGAQTTNATVFGVDSNYIKDGHVFSEYRMGETLAGRDAQAAVGVRQMWQPFDNVNLLGGFERVHELGTVNTSEATAITSALEYTAGDFKGTARLEGRNSATAKTILNTFGLAYRISDRWTMLGKSILEVADNKTAADTMLGRVQVGGAYRDETGNLNALARVEQRAERTGASVGVEEIKRDVSIASMQLNLRTDRKTEINGRYAGKLLRERSFGLVSATTAHLLSGGLLYDISNDWDIGVNVSTLFSGNLRSHQIGLGLEAGYQITKNTWVSLGYNVFGFVDRDLADENHTARGIYIRLRFKFDESLFQK